MERRTVDLSDYPDLVVIYLGMRVNRLRGLPTLLQFGPRLRAIAENPPKGLLAGEPRIPAPVSEDELYSKE